MALGNLGGRTDRKIDIVFCIDGTGSMTPCIDKVKANAKKFYKDFVEKMTADYNTDVDRVCVKVITFRDFHDDGDKSLVESEWFDLSAGDDAKYDYHLHGIVAEGGGDDPENGLEALFTAMKCDWNAMGDKDRQVIVLFTDADALALGDRQSEPGYPDKMPKDEIELQNAWLGARPAFLSQSEFKLKDRLKRLVIFAPAGTKYADLSKTYNRCQFIPVSLADGMAEWDFDDIIKIIAASASNV